MVIWKVRTVEPVYQPDLISKRKPRMRGFRSHAVSGGFVHVIIPPGSRTDDQYDLCANRLVDDP
jgi:hypothetical protein